MENKIAVVTGGVKGIGKAISDKLKKDGYKVLTISRTLTETNEYSYKGDVCNTDEINLIIEDIFSKYNNVDLLVNNAGITKDNLILKMSLDDFNQVLNTNLSSVFYISKLISKKMLKARKGKIINISSVVGLHGNIGQANYAASKAGIIGLTKSMAKEFASRGILVNAVAPGFIETDMTAVLPVEIKEAVIKNIPVQRFGQAEDVANAVSFLASESADYITGQVISVCGGMSI